MLRLQSVINSSDTVRVCSIGRRTLESIHNASNVIFRSHITINKKNHLSTISLTNSPNSLTNRLFFRNSFWPNVSCVKEFHRHITPECQADKTPHRRNNLSAAINEYQDEVQFKNKHSTQQLLHIQNAHHNELFREFPIPISSLHNIYSIVQSQLKLQRALVIKYQLTKIGWSCSCKVTWPEVKEFSSIERSKKAAASSAALKCLQWLKDIKKLKNGLPVVFDLGEINESLQRPSKIEIRDELKSKLEHLIKRYENKVEPIILKTELPKLKGPEEGTEEGSFAADVFYQYKQRNIISIPRVDPDTRNFELRSRLKERIPVDYDLPINAYRERILKVVDENQVVLIKGDTGCGKTTQVPQFIMDSFSERGEASNCNILVSEPRRISAISLAERIAHERGEKLGDVIGYKVKLHHKLPVTPGAILFCTTGIILKKFQENPDLIGCSHIIIDEVHERKVDVDIILALIKRVIKKRKDLKVILMSATLNAEMFEKYFDCVSLDVPGTAYPVKMNFLEDIAEVVNVDKSSEKMFYNNPQIECEEIAKLVQWISDNKPPGAILCFLPGWNEIVQVDTLLKQLNRRTPQLILPLHSQLSYTDQEKIFQKPPLGTRKIILSTDIAETGITVRDVVYVVDCAARKELRWDKEKEIDTMQNYKISRSNLHQRRGRAGRVRPGESYHFISKNDYRRLKIFQEPEIKCLSLERVCLDSKLCIDDRLEDFMLELPEPPDLAVLRNSVQTLIDLGALDKEERLTILGKKLAHLSLPPVLGKTLIYSTLFGCVDPILTVITMFSMNMELFRNSRMRKTEIRDVKRRFSLNSDHVALARIYEQWEDHEQKDDKLAENFSDECGMFNIRMYTLKKHRYQLMNQISEMLGMRETSNCYPGLNEYSKNNEMIRAVILAGMDHTLKHIKFEKFRNRLVKSHKTFHDENKVYTYTTPESVNHSREYFPSDYLTYIKKTFAGERQKMLVRDCSVVAPLTVALFSQGHLFGYEYSAVKSANPDDEDLVVENQILIKVSGKDNVSFVCDESLSIILFRFRDILWAVSRYLLDNQDHFPFHSKELHFVNQYKDDMLAVVDKILAEAAAPIESPEKKKTKRNFDFLSVSENEEENDENQRNDDFIDEEDYGFDSEDDEDDENEDYRR